MELYGTVTPILTPTHGRTDSINVDALRTHTKQLVDCGIHGLFPCGTNGEFSSFTSSQRRTVVETVVDTAPNTPVLAGCGSTSVTAVHNHIEAAADARVDAAAVITPYYLNGAQSGLRAFFTEIADESPLPIILYDVPALTGQSMSSQSVVHLSAHDMIKGVKISSNDIMKIHSIVNNTSDSFSVLIGNTAHSILGLDMGADGIVSGESNVIPKILSLVYNRYRDENRTEAVTFMNEIVYPLISVIRSMPEIPAIKYLTSLNGIEMGPPLPPLPKLTKEQKERLNEYRSRD